MTSFYQNERKLLIFTTWIIHARLKNICVKKLNFIFKKI